MTLAGSAMIGYGIYLFVEYEKSSGRTVSVSPTNAGGDLVELGWPHLTFEMTCLKPGLYVFDIGVVVFVISLVGCRFNSH